MNISDRVTELTTAIAAVKTKCESRLRTEEPPAGTSKSEFAKMLGEQGAAETLLMRQELDALKAPIVSMLEHQGRILIATAGGVFELKGDRLVWIRFRVENPAPN